MACRSTDLLEAWIESAERSLYDVASELRHVPLTASTRRLHVRALELKREIATWRARQPDTRARSDVLDAIEALDRDVQRCRSRASPPTAGPPLRRGPAPLEGT